MYGWDQTHSEYVWLGPNPLRVRMVGTKPTQSTYGWGQTHLEYVWLEPNPLRVRMVGTTPT